MSPGPAYKSPTIHQIYRIGGPLSFPLGAGREPTCGDQEPVMHPQIGHRADQFSDRTGSDVILVSLALHDTRPTTAMHHQVNSGIPRAARSLDAIASSLEEQAHVRLKLGWRQRGNALSGDQLLSAALLNLEFDKHPENHRTDEEDHDQNAQTKENREETSQWPPRGPANQGQAPQIAKAQGIEQVKLARWRQLLNSHLLTRPPCAKGAVTPEVGLTAESCLPREA